MKPVSPSGNGQWGTGDVEMKLVWEIWSPLSVSSKGPAMTAEPQSPGSLGWMNLYGEENRR